MRICLRADSVVIDGYVNAVERNSKPLRSRIGKFVERICKGAFSDALKRNDDVHVLLNHDWSKDLGSTKQGNLELVEDNIGLHARAVITDADVIEKARNGELVGWSFGFQDNDVDNDVDNDTGLPLRKVRSMDLREVSILDRSKHPAYEGTLIMARSDEDVQYLGEPFIDEESISIREETVDEERASDGSDETQPQQDEHPEAIEPIDYSIYESMIAEMKGV